MKTVTSLPSMIITIPVLNEEETLFKKVSALHKYVQNNLSKIVSTSIVIADNGSQDKTLKVAEILCKSYENIHILSVDKRGVGLALKASWSKYESDIMGYMDLDLATDLCHIDEAVNILLSDEYKIICGSRLMKQSRVIGRSRIRTLTSITFNKLIQVVFNIKFTDGMCGFKFFKKEVLADLNGPESIHSDGWFFATEFVILLEKLKYNIKDIPIKWTDDQSSKVKILTLSFQYMLEIISLKRRIK